MRTKLLSLFVRRRTVNGREVQEPTLLTMMLSAVGFLFLLAICAVGIASLPAFGSMGWTFAGVVAILVFLIIRFRSKQKASSISHTGRQRWFGRIRQGERLALIGVLACWLGLIV